MAIGLIAGLLLAWNHMTWFSGTPTKVETRTIRYRVLYARGGREEGPCTSEPDYGSLPPEILVDPLWINKTKLTADNSLVSRAGGRSELDG